jgi:hypothetical protein
VRPLEVLASTPRAPALESCAAPRRLWPIWNAAGNHLHYQCCERERFAGALEKSQPCVCICAVGQRAQSGTTERNYPVERHTSAPFPACALPPGDLGRERVEQWAPEAPKLLQPCIDGGERAPVDGVEATRALGRRKESARKGLEQQGLEQHCGNVLRSARTGAGAGIRTRGYAILPT